MSSVRSLSTVTLPYHEYNLSSSSTQQRHTGRPIVESKSIRGPRLVLLTSASVFPKVTYGRCPRFQSRPVWGCAPEPGDSNGTKRSSVASKLKEIEAKHCSGPRIDSERLAITHGPHPAAYIAFRSHGLWQGGDPFPLQSQVFTVRRCLACLTCTKTCFPQSPKFPSPADWQGRGQTLQFMKIPCPANWRGRELPPSHSKAT